MSRNAALVRISGNFSELSGLRRCCRRLLTGALVVIGAAFPISDLAFAACTPPIFDAEDEIIVPIVPGGTVTCVGATTVGVSTSVSNLTIDIEVGASITDSWRAIDLSGDVYTINNHGSLTGIGSDGIKATGGNVSIDNWGAIASDSQQGIYLYGSVSGTFNVTNNLGATIISTAADESGIYVDNHTLGGLIENFGSISGGSNAVYIENSNNIAVVNHEGASMHSTEDQGIGVRGSNMTVENRGTLTGAEGVSVEFADTVLVDNYGSITSSGDGLRIDDDSNNVTLINHETGTINSGTSWGGLSNRSGYNNTLTNLGVINSQNDGMVGSGGTGLVLTNSGSITSMRHGVRSDGANGIVVNNTGTIAAEGIGINTEATSTNADISNSGSINGVEFGVNLAGSDAFFSNTGSVTAVDDGLGLGGVSATNITVENSGAIFGDRNGIRLVDGANGTTINNNADGVIEGSVVGIQILGTATNTTINNAFGGTISGISGGEGVEIVSNRGAITSSVLLAGGGDTFSMSYASGSVIGNIDGGDGVDKFIALDIDDFGVFERILNFEVAEIPDASGLMLLADTDIEVTPFVNGIGVLVGELNSGSSLEFSSGLEANGNTTFRLNAGSRLTLGETTTAKSGELSFIGEGAAIAMALVTDGGEIANRLTGDDGLLLANGLTATNGSFTNLGTAKWFGSAITGGELDGETLSHGVLNEIGGNLSVIATSLLTAGAIVNKGSLAIGNTLLMDASVLSNRPGATIELEASGQILDSVSGLSQLENHGGAIIKSGGGLSQISVGYTSDGGTTRVTAGTLQFNNSVTFDGENSVAISAGANLVLKGPEVNISDKLDVTGEGMLSIEGDLLGLGSSLDFRSPTQWSGDRIVANTVDVFSSFSIVGDEPVVLDAVLAPFGTLSNLIISNSISSDGGEGSIDNRIDGQITIDAPGRTIDIRVPLNSDATVVAGEGANVTFHDTAQVEPLIGLAGADVRLTEGTWEVKDGAVLELRRPSDSTMPAIGIIDATAKVILRGTGRLNNLPFENNIIRFENSGVLELRDGAKMGDDFGNGGVLMNHGTFVIDATSTWETSIGGITGWGVVDLSAGEVSPRRALRGRPGSITIIDGHITLSSDGDVSGLAAAHFEPGSTIEGSGSINGHLISEGLFAPGRSPGTFTVDGKYTQTAMGVLELEIGGTTPAIEFDQLIVNGTATFEPGATIDVRFLPGANISAGAIVDFVVADVFTGDMTEIVFNIFGLPDLAAVELNLGVSGLSLTALEDISTVPLPGSLLFLFSALTGFAGFQYKRNVPGEL